MVISGFGGYGRHECGFVQLVCREPVEEALTNRFVVNNGIGADQACDVERLGRSSKRYTVLSRCFGYRGKRVMFGSEERHIGMNFIGNDEYVVHRFRRFAVMFPTAKPLLRDYEDYRE